MADTLDLARLEKLLAEATRDAGRPIVLQTGPYPYSEADAPAWPYDSAVSDEDGDRVASFIDASFAALAVAAVNALPHLLSRISEFESALRPFSEACTISNHDDESDIDDTLAALKIKWKHLRQARNVLGEKA